MITAVVCSDKFQRIVPNAADIAYIKYTYVCVSWQGLRFKTIISVLLDTQFKVDTHKYNFTEIIRILCRMEMNKLFRNEESNCKINADVHLLSVIKHPTSRKGKVSSLLVC